MNGYDIFVGILMIATIIFFIFLPIHIFNEYIPLKEVCKQKGLEYSIRGAINECYNVTDGEVYVYKFKKIDGEYKLIK